MIATAIARLVSDRRPMSNSDNTMEVINSEDSGSDTSNAGSSSDADADHDDRPFTVHTDKKKLKKQKQNAKREEKRKMSENPNKKSSVSKQIEEGTRLYFPRDCPLTYSEKIKWVVKIRKEKPEYLVQYKEGKHRAYVLAKEVEAIEMLTGNGFDGVKLEKPEENENVTKIIIKRYPVFIEMEYVTEHENVVWAKRNTFLGQEKEQVIALWKGLIPPEVNFIPGLPMNLVAEYRESPIFCFRCSGWGHKAWKCHAQLKCKICSGRHESKICQEEIKNGKDITRRCANCGGGHAATAPICPKRPIVNRPAEIIEEAQKQSGYIVDEREFPVIPLTKSKSPSAVSSSADIASNKEKKENNWMAAGAGTATSSGGTTVREGGGGGRPPKQDNGQVEIKELAKIMENMEEQHKKQMEELEEKHLKIVS